MQKVPEVRRALTAAEALAHILGEAEEALGRLEREEGADVALLAHRQGSLQGLRAVVETVADYVSCLDECVNDDEET